MSEKIFTLQADNRLLEMTRSAFASEDVFQKILADHPAVLGGISGRAPLLVRREQEIADSVNGSARWSLDHLYVDRDGVPILVEVKRASDTRLRREVVGQMLDYAANGSVHWKVSDLIESFSLTCAEQGRSPEEALGELLQPEQTAEAFWHSVESNLRAGRVRMVFVADEIPPELRRVIEFLNEQMRPAEVVAVQIENYENAAGVRTLVPRVIGTTARAEAVKSVDGDRMRLSADEWFALLLDERGEEAFAGASRIAEWFAANGLQVVPTESGDALAAGLTCDDGKTSWPLFIRRSNGGRFEIALGYLSHRPAFKSESSRQEALERFKAISGATFRSTGKLTGWPSIPASEALSDNVFVELKSYLEWLVKETRKAE